MRQVLYTAGWHGSVALFTLGDTGAFFGSIHGTLKQIQVCPAQPCAQPCAALTPRACSREQWLRHVMCGYRGRPPQALLDTRRPGIVVVSRWYLSTWIVVGWDGKLACGAILRVATKDCWWPFEQAQQRRGARGPASIGQSPWQEVLPMSSCLLSSCR